MSLVQIELFSPEIPPLDLPEPYAIQVSDEIQEALREGAVVALSVSGGKDSAAAALRTNDYLHEIGHTGPRILIHSDLGRTEWQASLPECRRLADRLDLELMVVRREAGDMLARWQQRWHDNRQRYSNLQCVSLISPWPSATWRYCTSELKVAIITQALTRRFPHSKIISVIGIRRSESDGRRSAPVSAPCSDLFRTKLETTGFTWNPIVTWSLNDVFSYLELKNFPLHEAYTVYQSSRVSCCFCVLGKQSDLRAATKCKDNHAIYRETVAIEIVSGFSFQSNGWLGDVAPHLLTPPMQQDLADAKTRGERRKTIEAQIPKELRFTKGWPTACPTEEQARILAEVRQQMGELYQVPVLYTTPSDVLARYDQLLAEKARRDVQKAKRKPKTELLQCA